jgi:hypothetical protein
MELTAMLASLLKYFLLGLMAGWMGQWLLRRLNHSLSRRRLRRQGFVFLRPYVAAQSADSTTQDRATP